MRARIAAHSRWAHEDGKPNAARATAGFRRRFEDEVDPERVLPEDERRRRADHALRAHMLRLAMLSAQARGKGQVPAA